VNDTYRFNPWRSPGAAPVNDVCGMAGGTLPQHYGPGEAVFYNNSFASMGDLGSQVLKPAPSGTVWTVGTSVKVRSLCVVQPVEKIGAAACGPWRDSRS
jgi:hypothetical protein